MVVVAGGEQARRRAQDSSVTLAGKLAALTGAAGAALSGEAVAEITYVPTAGVIAAEGIPGFSFNASTTTVTSGTLRPPASVGTTGWDVDNDGNVDFQLRNVSPAFASLAPAAPFHPNFNGLLNESFGSSSSQIRNLANAAVIGPAQTFWQFGVSYVTSNATQNLQTAFTPNVPGYFGFRFAFGSDANDYYYGWASMTIDLSAAGQGYKITEAFYQSTPNTAINVGQVPVVPVPEPSSLALLAAGAAGVAAWRARKKPPVAAA